MKDELSCTIPVAVWQPFEGEDAAMLPKVYSLPSVRTQENDFIGMNETVLPTCFAKRSPTHLLQRYVESSETYEDLGTLLEGKEEFNVIQATQEVDEEDHHLPSCLNSVDTESSVATIRKKNENIHYSEVLNHLMEHKRIKTGKMRVNVGKNNGEENSCLVYTDRRGQYDHMNNEVSELCHSYSSLRDSIPVSLLEDVNICVTRNDLTHLTQNRVLPTRCDRCTQLGILARPSTISDAEETYSKLITVDYEIFDRLEKRLRLQDDKVNRLMDILQKMERSDSRTPIMMRSRASMKLIPVKSKTNSKNKSRVPRKTMKSFIGTTGGDVVCTTSSGRLSKTPKRFTFESY